MTKITVTTEIEVSDGAIDNIMTTALEGGINYWCSSALPKRLDYKGADYASHALSKGATLMLKIEDETVQELTKENFLKGLELFISKHGIPDYCGGDIDGMDATDADCVIQYAIFGKQIYG